MRAERTRTQVGAMHLVSEITRWGVLVDRLASLSHANPQARLVDYYTSSRALGRIDALPNRADSLVTWPRGQRSSGREVSVEESIWMALSKSGTPERVLDIGTGLGSSLVSLSASNPACAFIGVELIPHHVRIANKAVATRSNAVVFNADYHALIGYPDQYFDSVIALESLRESNDIRMAIHEIARVIKPHGRFVCVDIHAADNAEVSPDVRLINTVIGLLTNSLIIDRSTLDMTCLDAGLYKIDTTDLWFPIDDATAGPSARPVLGAVDEHGSFDMRGAKFLSANPHAAARLVLDAAFREGKSVHSISTYERA